MSNPNNSFCTMKKTIYILLAGFLAACLFSCMKQDDIYKEFVVPGGLKYPQKVDTLLVQSGFNKLSISWPKTVDPSVVKARLFWNAGQDSLEVDMTSVTDTARVVLEDLAEENYTFSIYTYDAQGNRSMPTEQTGMPYGEKYLTSKSLKEITSASMLTTTHAIINLSPAVADLQYCEITYTSTSGEEKTITVDAAAKSVQIPDFKNGAPYKIRCIYKPAKGVDEIPGEWIEYSDALEKEVLDLPKQTWQYCGLPGDTPRYGGWGLDLYALWNNSAGDIWASPQWQYPRNTRFTIDLGYTVSLSELQEQGELTLADALPDPAQIDFASDYFEVGSMTIPVIDHALACALRSITPDRRLIVLLSYLLDESDAEIAKELDLPKATVQDRRQKALKRLKELLESTP